MTFRFIAKAVFVRGLVENGPWETGHRTLPSYIGMTILHICLKQFFDQNGRKRNKNARPPIAADVNDYRSFQHVSPLVSAHSFGSVTLRL